MTPTRRRTIAIALGSAGAILRLWEYFGRGTLWLDEAAIARNVAARSPAALLRPLDFAQIAPKGFLLLEKLATDTLGTSDRALRLYSILTALASLPLFYALARRALNEKGALLAFAFFSLLARPVFYAAEAKPYGGDIFFACLLLLLGLRILAFDALPRHWLRLGALGAVAVWFSQPALFVLGGIGLALTIAVAQRRVPLRWPAVVACALWAISGIPSIWWTLHSLAPHEHAYMLSFWGDGFWPLRPHSLREAAWPVVNLYGLFRDPLGMPVAIAGLALFVLGVATFARRRPVVLAALIGPIVALYVASALGIYPFDTTIAGFNKIAAGNGRVLMFLVPSLVLVVTAGLMALLESPIVDVRRVGLVSAVFVVGVPLYYDLTGLPHSPNDVTPIVNAMHAARKPDDRLYVYYGGTQPFEWYRDRFPFADDHVVRGGCYRPAWREYLRELDAFRGRGRVWVVIVHPAWVGGIHEGDMIEEYLDDVAPKVGRWGAKDAFALLYDFSAIAPLARPAVAWHPPPRALPQDTVPLGFACDGVFPGPGVPRPPGPSR
ncbi:MAG: glycosyltransferase family 39 protein [Gemmatimonadaceae bacterium]